MNSKGLFNIELMISILILIIIFTLFLSLTLNEFQSIDETQNRKESRIITSDISKIITKVYQNQNGYSINYKLPDKINKETYILKINNSGVYINSHYQIIYNKIIPNTLTQKQYFLEPGNVYEFININNTVHIIQKN